MQVLVKPLVDTKLLEILDALLRDGYFNMKDGAVQYVKAIRKFIDDIPNKTARKTMNAQHGAFYATYKPNRHTTWYILFDVEDDIYLVRNVINNHTRDYPRLIGKLK